MFSVVIPAHNEASVMARCLDALFSAGDPHDKEVIVVCNGCKDNTAAIASRFDRVKVIELDVASKIAALNAGDQAATLFPRVYLDADICCSLEQLQHCIDTMGPEHGIAAPASIMDLSGSSWFVRAYLTTWMQLPYYKSGHMVGSGIYILTESGRNKFNAWPDIIADDAYVRALFSFSEIHVDRDSQFTIFAPKSLSGLVKIRTRARFGNMQVESRYPSLKVLGENSNNALLSLLFQKPQRVLHWLTYVSVQFWVIRKCKQKLKNQDYSSWERDESARSG